MHDEVAAPDEREGEQGAGERDRGADEEEVVEPAAEGRVDRVLAAAGAPRRARTR